MVLGVALISIAFAAVALIVLPLMRKVRPAPERGAFDRAVYREQIKELERDLARGLIDAAQLASARLEVDRRLLATAELDGRALETSPTPRLALALAFGLPIAAGVIYLAVGSPGLPDLPFAARTGEREPTALAQTGHMDFAAGVARLEQQLEQNPADAEKWLLLARTKAELGEWQGSADAYRRVMALTGNRPDLASSYGEMLVMAADGIVTPAAQQQFAAALAHDPGDVPARFYVALAAAQAGDSRSAIEQWRRLAGDVEAPDMRAEIGRRIEEAARAAGIPPPPLPPPPAAADLPPASPPDAAEPGPTEQDLAGASQMSDEDRMAMIRAMVGRLAARQQANPNDLDGWLRLGRAYGVLGEGDKAIDAYEHALALLPVASDRRPGIAAAIAALKAR